jgi:isorenieratene synthase
LKISRFARNDKLRLLLLPHSPTRKRLPVTNSSPSQPLIIGGGIAGLMTALHLAERGLKPLVLEADPEYVGGRLKDGPLVSVEMANKTWHFPGEHGVHGIWEPYRNFKHALSRHHLLPELIAAQEETWIYGRGQKVRQADMGSAIRGSWIPAPFHYLHLFLRPRFLNILTLRDLASLFRVTGSLFSAMAIDPIAEQKSLAGLSLADFTAGWSPTLQSFFAGLARNALAGHPEDVPAAGFIAFLRFYTLMRRAAWQYHYLPGPGGSVISQPLAEQVTALGGEIRLGTKAWRLHKSQPSEPNSAWLVELEGAGAESDWLRADDLILALDAPSTRALLLRSPSTATWAKSLWFPTGVPTAIFRLWFDSSPRRVAEAGIFSGDFVMDNFFWLDRLQPEFKAWAEETGGSAVEMHIYGPPELLQQPDALLLAHVITDTYRAFPELRGGLLKSNLSRNEATHTLFSVGKAGQHLQLETRWPNLWVCGDWTAYPTPALYLERATTTAIAAANAVLSRYQQKTHPLQAHPEPEWLAGQMEQAWRWVRGVLLRWRGA